MGAGFPEGVLTRVAEVGFPEGLTPVEALASILVLAREVTGAALVSLFIPPEQALALLQGEPSGAGAASLGSGLELCWRGLPAEGALVIPTASGALALGGVEGLGERATLVLGLLAAHAASTASWADQLEQAERRAAEEAEAQEELRLECARLRELSEVDELTGLFNRRFFNRQLEHEVRRHRRYGHPLSLALVDLDYFKRINDTYGHAVGDAALCHVAEVALTTMRTADLVARIGGDELALLMPETALSGGVRAAERLCEAVATSPLAVEGGRCPLTLSIGVANIEDAGSLEAEAFLEAADAALYRAKAHGRNQVAVGRSTIVPGR